MGYTERIFGVFPKDENGIFLPQEFPSRKEAEQYQNWLKEWHGIDSEIEEAL